MDNNINTENNVSDVKPEPILETVSTDNVAETAIENTVSEVKPEEVIEETASVTKNAPPFDANIPAPATLKFKLWIIALSIASIVFRGFYTALYISEDFIRRPASASSIITLLQTVLPFAAPVLILIYVFMMYNKNKGKIMIPIAAGILGTVTLSSLFLGNGYFHVYFQELFLIIVSAALITATVFLARRGKSIVPYTVTIGIAGGFYAIHLIANVDSYLSYSLIIFDAAQISIFIALLFLAIATHKKPESVKAEVKPPVYATVYPNYYAQPRPQQQGAYYAQPQAAPYPPRQNVGYYPPPQGYAQPPQGYVPNQQGYVPPQQGAYYPPQQGGYYPPQQPNGFYPPQHNSYYPPQPNNYPPRPQGGYYPPQPNNYYPPQQGYAQPPQGYYQAPAQPQYAPTPLQNSVPPQAPTSGTEGNNA